MSSGLLPLTATVADNRRSHYVASAFTARPVVDYLQQGSYLSYSQASSRAYLGTLPVYDISTAVPAFQEDALYNHPDAIPNGLVAAADEYAIYEPTTWCAASSYNSGAPPGSVPLTPEAIAYQAAQAAQSCDSQTESISPPATSLHIDTTVVQHSLYPSAQLSSTVSPTFSHVSVHDTNLQNSALSPSQDTFYSWTATDLTSASTVDPGEQPFIFAANTQPFLVSSPISPTVASPYGTTWDTGGDESTTYTSGYKPYPSSVHAVQSPVQAPAPTTLAVPTPRAAAAEDVPERLERYVSGSPDATPAPQHVAAFAADGTHAIPPQPHSGHSSPSLAPLAKVQQVPFQQGHDDVTHVPSYGSTSAPPSAFCAGPHSAVATPTGTAPHSSTFTGTLHYHSPSAYPGALSSTSVLDAGARAKKGRRRKRTPEPRKPLVMACLFCRGRKIACGPPPAGSGDRSCDQCKRRDQPCEYPLECRRGQRKPRSDRSITTDDDERGRANASVEGERRLAPALPSTMPWSST